SDPIVANLRAGVVSSVKLEFRPINPVNAVGDFIGNVTRISASSDTTFVHTAEGKLLYSGFFPMYPSVSSPTALPALGLGDVLQLAGSIRVHACAIRKADRSVWCWGNNSNGQLGPAGPTDLSATERPVRVPGITALAIAVGDQHSCAISAADH